MMLSVICVRRLKLNNGFKLIEYFYSINNFIVINFKANPITRQKAER